MTYKVILSRQAHNYYARLPRDLARQLSEAIDSLESDPHPLGSKPLTGEFEGLLRIRVRHLRVVYQVQQDLGRIRIVDIGPRGDVY